MNAKEQYQIKNFSKNLKEFLFKYRIQYQSGRVIRQQQPVSYRPWEFVEDYRNLYMNVKEVPAVDLTISEDDLNTLINDLSEIDTCEYLEYCQMKRTFGETFLLDLQFYKSQQVREQQARQRNPGVQKAWENYQLMLKLSGG